MSLRFCWNRHPVFDPKLRGELLDHLCLIDYAKVFRGIKQCDDYCVLRFEYFPDTQRVEVVPCL